MTSKSLSVPAVFSFEPNLPLRVIEIDGDPWFVLRDLLVAMDSSTPTTVAIAAIKQGLGEGFNVVKPLETSGGTQEITIVAEAGATYLVSRSNTETGRRLNRFLHAEVLPALRKTGRYDMQPAQINPANMSRIQLLQLAMDAETERMALEHRVNEIQPKADALDLISTASDGATNITQSAKALGMNPKALFTWLHANEWIYRRAGGSGWVAYQRRIQQGLLEHKVTTVRREDGTEKMVEQVLLTGKGIAKIALLQGCPA